MFTNLSQREKILLIAALLIVIVVGYYFYIYRPAKRELTRLEAEKETAEDKLENARLLAQKLPALREEYNELKVQYQQREAFYEDKTEIDLLIDMREAAADNEVELVHFRPVKGEDRITMDVSLKGTYFQLCDLFRDFRSWSSNFEFSNLKLKGQDKLIDVSMSVVFHKQNSNTAGDTE